MGFKAYLVGGGVRDLLLGREPKDFDVVTDARPEQIRKVFRNCRLIGRRFRLAHVYFKRDVVEVATFRALLEPNASPDEDAEVQASDGEQQVMRQYPEPLADIEGRQERDNAGDQVEVG